MRAAMWASQKHFALQYIAAFALFAGTWALLYFIGRSLFVREKML